VWLDVRPNMTARAGAQVDASVARPESQTAVLLSVEGSNLYTTRCVFHGDGVNSQLMGVQPDMRLYMRGADPLRQRLWQPTAFGASRRMHAVVAACGALHSV
jgi:hypothetical protein